MTQKESKTTADQVESRNELPEFPFAVDIYDQGDEVVLVGDMPGVSGDSVDVHYERGNLTIRGRVRRPAHEGSWALEEYRVGDFSRSFTVSEDIDPAGIEADMKNGVLTLRLPKAAERKPRKIPVRAG